MTRIKENELFEINKNISDENLELKLVKAKDFLETLFEIMIENNNICEA